MKRPSQNSGENAPKFKKTFLIQLCVEFCYFMVPKYQE